MTIGEALRLARRRLQHSDSPDLDAQLLLTRTLDAERVHLFAHPEREVTTAQQTQFEGWLSRRVDGEPVAYILGGVGFYDMELRVTPDVLIPRPETELLLEEALRLIDADKPAVVADIGTGSGALAVAFKRHRPLCAVYATDICEAALDVARENARRHDANIVFLQGDLACPLIARGVEVDLLMANLPYIESDELAGLDVARHEPRLALDGGEDGLRLIRGLMRQLDSVCKPGGRVLLEIGAGQGDAVRRLARDIRGVDVQILRDYAGLERIARLTPLGPPVESGGCHCHRDTEVKSRK